MAIATITRSTTTINDGFGAYNDTVTALLVEHSSAGAHNLTAYVTKALFDANTILYATTDDTPAALTIAASRIVGRASSGAITALTAAQVLTILGLDSNLADLATAEVQQLENIGATTISAAQWGYLGACGTGGGQLLAALTTGESTQLEAIGATTISANQWAWLGGYSINAMARAYGDTAQLNIADNTYTKVNLNQESYDPGGNFDAATNYRFVAPVTGYYQVSAMLHWTQSIADKVYYAYIYKNGTVICQGSSHTSATYGVSISLADIIYLTADQYLELWGRHFTGAATSDIVAGEITTFLSVHFLSKA